MSEIEPADPRERRRAFIVLALGLVAGLVLLLLAQAHLRELEELTERDVMAGAAALIRTIRWAIVLLVVPMTAFLAYLGWIALRIIRDRHFPPVGMRILRDTTILDGPRAVIRGWILALITLLIGLAVMQLTVTLWSLADELGRGDDAVEPPASVEANPR